LEAFQFQRAFPAFLPATIFAFRFSVSILLFSFSCFTPVPHSLFPSECFFLFGQHEVLYDSEFSSLVVSSVSVSPFILPHSCPGEQLEREALNASLLSRFDWAAHGGVRFPSTPLIIAVLFGMYVTGVLAYTPTDAVHSLPLPSIMLPFRAIGLFIFRTQFVLKLVFWSAVIAHVGEGVYAYSVCKSRSVSPSRTIAWVSLVTLVGYPFLSLLLQVPIPPDNERSRHSHQQ